MSASTVLRRTISRRIPHQPVRALSTTVVTRKDFVQGIYLKEIKAYTPAPVAADAHVGVVKSYAAPASPKAPALPANLAADIAQYDAEEPTLADSAGKATSEGETGEGHGGPAYLAFLEQDLPEEHQEAH